MRQNTFREFSFIVQGHPAGQRQSQDSHPVFQGSWPLMLAPGAPLLVLEITLSSVSSHIKDRTMMSKHRPFLSVVPEDAWKMMSSWLSGDTTWWSDAVGRKPMCGRSGLIWLFLFITVEYLFFCLSCPIYTVGILIIKHNCPES